MSKFQAHFSQLNVFSLNELAIVGLPRNSEKQSPNYEIFIIPQMNQASKIRFIFH